MPSLKYGEPTAYMDVAAGTFSAEGDVEVVGKLVLQNHVIDTTAPDQIQSAAVGGGVYEGLAGAALAAGAEVEWDGTANAGAGGWIALAAGVRYGMVAADSSAAGAGETIRVLHWPA